MSSRFTIDWRRARETGRVVARKIGRGLSLLGWCSLAWFGSAAALFFLGFHLLRCAFAMGAAQQIDKTLVALSYLAREQVREPASWGSLLVTLLAASIAVTVWSLRKIVQWHSDKKELAP